MAQSNWTLPPCDGSLSLPELVDLRLQRNASDIYAILVAEDPGHEVTQISFLEWTRAIHRLAYILRPKPDFESHNVVALVMNCDTIMYTTAVMAVMRAGLVPYPMSNRNSPAAICHMLQKTSCHRIIATSRTLGGLISGVMAEASSLDYSIQIDELPSLPDVFPHFGHETVEYDFLPYPQLPNCGPEETIVYLHSSGSTGFPKSIIHTNRTLMRWYTTPLGADFARHPKHLTIAAMQLPAFHFMGIANQIWSPLIVGTTAAMFAPKEPDFPVVPTPENTLEGMKATGVNCVVAVPTFVEVWAGSDDAVEFLSDMEVVLCGGGPLSSEVGDRLVSKGIHLRSCYGGTEFGAPSYFIPPETLADRKDWEWLCFDPNVSLRMSPFTDSKYELQILDSEAHPVLIHNISDVVGYATSDLFEKHATRQGLWRIVGRIDDVITLASGEKAIPNFMEGAILSSHLVSGAIMFGRARNQVGVLIQPRNPEDMGTPGELKNELWPVIEEANKNSPDFSRIFKEMILITSRDKPVHRTPKGTIMRRPTLANYAEEIDKLYDTNELAKGAEVEGPKTFELPDLESWLLEQAKSVNKPGHAESLISDVDLFAQGFDSLSATFLRNRIISALRSSDISAAKDATSSIAQNFVFTNNTIKSLASALQSKIFHIAEEDVPESHVAVMKRLIDKYSDGMMAVDISARRPLPPKATILLTGSTGGLGSYMLWMLLMDKNVERVYAVNRRSSKAILADRQRAAFEERGLPLEVLTSEKLILVEGEEAREKLGLEDVLYEEIRSTCTHIVHNAWRLDFNLSVLSFEPNIKGTRNLIDLALASVYGSDFRFLFASSISVAQSWGKNAGPFPEEPNLRIEVSVGGGYGESKSISERILVKAAELGIQTTSLRIGQVCGGKPDGYWATTDWVPLMVKSSRTMGFLPDAYGVATWLPTEAVSRIILDVAFSPECPALSLNVVHPNPVPWATLLKGIGSSLCKIVDGENAVPLSSLPISDWVALLEKRAIGASEDDIVRIPAIKLLEFFRRMATGDERLNTSGRAIVEAGEIAPAMMSEKAQSVSKTLREVKQLEAEDIDGWIKYWKRKGMFM